MKKFLILLLTLTLILGVFSSCGKKYVNPLDDETSNSPSEDTSTESTTGYITESNETNQTENTETNDRLTDIDGVPEAGEIEYVSSYEIKKIGDQWYIIFNSYRTPPKQGHYDEMEIYGLEIGTMESFQKLMNRLLSGNLELSDMQYIVNRFTRDDIGIPIHDYSVLYVPKIIDAYQMEESAWWYDGEDYSPGCIMSNDVESVAVLHIIDEQDFNSNQAPINCEYVRTVQNESKTVKIYNNSKYSEIFLLFFKEGDLYYKYEVWGVPIEDDNFVLSLGIEKYEG